MRKLCLNVNLPSKSFEFISQHPQSNFSRREKHFESIRLFLSNYGFCSLDSISHFMKNKPWVRATRDLFSSNAFFSIQNENKSSIQILNSTNETFFDEMKKLDQISPILFCTGFIFYLKTKQTTLADSFANLVTRI